MSRNAVAVCRVFDEMLNRGRFDVADEICAADAELHAPLSNVGTGPEGLRQLASGMRLGFADLEVAIDDLIVAEDKVVVRWHTVRQTHTGLYRGVPPTGRSLKVTAIQIFRMEDAMIAEAWLEIDALGAARAMGIVPSEDDSAGRRALFTIGSLFRMAFLEARWAMRSRGR
jgi:predicted ester cyclase